MRIIEINGNNFSNLAEFYNEIELQMTNGLDWKIGRNLNAFNDILSGGFGVHEVDENYEMIWVNSEKSMMDLGWKETIKFIENNARNCHPTNIEFVKKDLEDAKNGIGKTLYELIIEIIKEHNKIKLKLT